LPGEGTVATTIDDYKPHKTPGRMLVLGSIAPVVPPTLAAVTRAAAIRFREDLYRYHSTVEEIYNSSSGSGPFHYTSTWSMVEVNVLQSMHGCGVFDNLEGLTQPQSVEDVTDSHIEKFLEKRCDSDIRDLTQRVKVAIAMSPIHSDSQDPEGTVYTFMGNVYKQLNKQGALSVLQQGSGVRSMLSQLIEKLAPPVFKCAVADSFDLWEEEERNTWKKAVQTIAQIARDTCIAWPTQPGQKRQRDEDEKPTGWIVLRNYRRVLAQLPK
jgi:hypothetical protein